jgi:hypothetical protein
LRHALDGRCLATARTRRGEATLKPDRHPSSPRRLTLALLIAALAGCTLIATQAVTRTASPSQDANSRDASARGAGSRDAGAQAAREGHHPHLLLSRDDPFTGLPALARRYAAGRRPSEDVCGDALGWLVTGDAAHADQAVARMRRERPPQQVGSRTYAAYVCWSLAFDWLYDYPGFDAALKDQLAGDLLRAAERMLDDVTLRDPDHASYQNYPVRFLTLASFALAAVREHPSTAARATVLWPRVRRAFDNILDTADLVTPDGSYHESMDYMRITMASMTLLAELRRTVDGDDPAWRAGAYRNISRTYLYKLLPDGTSSREGDDEYPFPKRDDNVVLAYAVSRFKDPYAAWIQRESGWLSSEWLVPVLEFLWMDPDVHARDPRLATASELPRHQWFRGVDHVVLRDGWGPDATWIQFLAGPFFAKHQHLDRNAFTIYHRGYLAVDSGADYTDTESPHYLNYYRRTIAHNTLLVYDPGERFFWGEDLWRAANDGGQRMDSSRYWNTIRSRDDWQRTRDLWDVAHVEAASFHEVAQLDAGQRDPARRESALREATGQDGARRDAGRQDAGRQDAATRETASQDAAYQYVRGNATNAYASHKLALFTRELLYLPSRRLLAVFDRVRTTDPAFRKVWLLHGVSRPEVDAAGPVPGAATAGSATATAGVGATATSMPRPIEAGPGGTSYGAATSITWRDGGGVLRVHPVLPRAREVIVRGGSGSEFWTPGDDRGGAWGSGQNWPLEPWAGGPLPADPFLTRMWKTFWGPSFDRLLPSNSKHVVPGGWRMEITPTEPAVDDRFLNLLEIDDQPHAEPPHSAPSTAAATATPLAPAPAPARALAHVEPIEGHRFAGAAAGGLLLLFATDPEPAIDGEVTIPQAAAALTDLFVTGLEPNARYELQWTTLGIPRGRQVEVADEGGVLHVAVTGSPAERLRLRRLTIR